MTEIDELIKSAEVFSDTDDVALFPVKAFKTIKKLAKVVKEQQQQLERLKEIAFADQTDYLIVGTLRQELSPSQTGEDVV
jgi:hypothetical protein